MLTDLGVKGGMVVTGDEDAGRSERSGALQEKLNRWRE